MNKVYDAALEVQRFFDEQNWRFCIIGGLAVIRWGQQRATRDVDFSLLTGIGDERHFLDLIAGHFPERFRNEVEFAVAARVYRGFASSGAPIDIALAAFPFEEAVIRRATPFEFRPGCFIRTCSAEDLIVMKTFAGREIDIHDVRYLIASQWSRLNWEQIERDLQDLGDATERFDAMPRLAELRQQVEMAKRDG